MKDSTGRYLAGALVCLLALTAVGTPAIAASSHTTLAVDDATVTEDETTSVAVTLSSIPAGLSGFDIAVELDDPGAGTITDATVDAFRPNSTEISDDGSSVELVGTDLGNRFQPGDGPVTLATVTVRGDTVTETGLELQVHQVDDDDGSRIEPATTAGRLTVAAADDGGGGSGGSDPGGSDDDSSGSDPGGSDGDDPSGSDTTGDSSAPADDGAPASGGETTGTDESTETSTPTTTEGPTTTDTRTTTDTQRATDTETATDARTATGTADGEAGGGAVPPADDDGGIGPVVLALVVLAILGSGWLLYGRSE